MPQPNPQTKIVVAILCVLTLAAILVYLNVVTARRSNLNASLGSGISKFLGFVQPGSETPEMLDLLAKRGIGIRDATGVVQPVIIDIKLGGFPNSISLKDQGKIPVAILSTAFFDAPANVDKTSLTFGHSGDEKTLAFCDLLPQDVNGDGLPDLVCHFTTQKTAFQVGDVVGVLKGTTVGLSPMIGKDSVRIVP